jgi:hypothetical protein
MNISVHDNRVIAYQVDCERRRIVLHTRFDEREPVELTDVIFEGVEAYELAGDNFGNILFDVREIPIAQLVDEHRATFAEGVVFAWPGSWNESPEAALRHFEAEGVKAFEIASAFGLAGWVVARACRREGVTPA